jgi:hypothetical protein
MVKSSIQGWGLQRFALVLLLVGVTMFGAAFPGLAATCRQSDGHQLCLLKIERSAKHYWEYWATLQIDGVTQPKTIYDCRYRVTIGLNQSRTRFSDTDIGALVCRLYKGERVS